MTDTTPLGERCQRMTMAEILSELRDKAGEYNMRLGWGGGNSSPDTLDVKPYVTQAIDYRGVNPLGGRERSA